MHLEKLLCGLSALPGRYGDQAAAATQRFWGDWNRQNPCRKLAVWQKHWPDWKEMPNGGAPDWRDSPLAESLAGFAQSWYNAAQKSSL